MVRQAVNRPESDAPCTVLVLGCEIRGLRPSKMLQARIDSAYAYLTANPRAVCVACGGMADDEIISEITPELMRVAQHAAGEAYGLISLVVSFAMEVLEELGHSSVYTAGTSHI